MNQHERSALRELQSSGVQATKGHKVCPNDGSETHRHLQAKASLLYIGLANDYRVDSEVEVPGGYEIDILFWGNPDRLTYAVEAETSPDSETIDKKLNRYVRGIDAIDDMLTVNLNQISESRCEMLGEIANQIGLDP